MERVVLRRPAVRDVAALDTCDVKGWVSPDELGRRCGVDGKRMRAWLRERWREGHPLLYGHGLGQPWQITTEVAAELEAEFTSHRQPASRRAGSGGGRRSPRATTAARASTTWPRSEDPGHRVTEDWMGTPTETLS